MVVPGGNNCTATEIDRLPAVGRKGIGVSA